MDEDNPDPNIHAQVDGESTTAPEGADKAASQTNVATTGNRSKRPTCAAEKRKAGQGPQEMIKSRVVDIAETEHDKTMQYLALKKKNAQIHISNYM
mgnify:CR=1 FL=1